MVARAITWWTILRVSLEERLMYRGDFALGTLMRFLPIVTQIFLWGAIFASRESAGGSGEIVGYTYPDFIAYYLLVTITRAFSSMPGLASGIALRIRNGEIKKFIIQPVDLIGFLLLSRIAHKLVYYFVAIVPFALVFVLCRDYFTAGWPDPARMVVYLTSLVLAFLLGFFLEATIGMIGFWFLEVSSLLFVYMLFNFFFSGHMFPVNMLPEPLYNVIMALPLVYLAYFPAAVFLEKVPTDEMFFWLGVQGFWVVFFMVACRWAMNRGLRRYSAFGG